MEGAGAPEMERLEDLDLVLGGVGFGNAESPLLGVIDAVADAASQSLAVHASEPFGCGCRQRWQTWARLSLQGAGQSVEPVANL